MDKSFICLVSCKPYDDLQEVIEGIKILTEEEENSLKIEPYLALADFDQLSDEEKGRASDIRFGTSVVCYNGSSSFAESVESQILKDKNAQFVFLGDGENRSIQQKLKSSIQAGLPVIVGIQGEENPDTLKEQLETFFGHLTDHEREEVTIVYRPISMQSEQMEEEKILNSLMQCRKILQDIGGESFAEKVKILYAISKYMPELLKCCLKGQIDGVCINPKTLPRKKEEIVHSPAPVAIEVESETERMPEQQIKEEHVEPVKEIRKPVTERKKARNAGQLLSGKIEGTCLVFCHPYENLNKTMDELKALTNGKVECLFALPFISLKDAAESRNVQCGVWGLSLITAGNLSYDVHFDMIKENRASFIVIGDRFRRNILNARDADLNQQLIKALDKGIYPLLGITSGNDLKLQLENVLQGISSANVENIGFVFYAGQLGRNVQDEAVEIEREVDKFRQAISELYDDDVASAVKVLLEISHFSEDPFSYLTHRSVDGITLSASAIKQEMLVSIPPAVQEVEEEAVVQEAAEEETAREVEALVEKVEEEQVEEEESDAPPEEERIEEKPVELAVVQSEEVAREQDEIDLPIETVKAVVGASVEMSEEEMAEWAEEHPVSDTGEKVSVEYEEVEREARPALTDSEESAPAIEEEKKVEEPKKTVKYEASTIEEGLQLVKLTVDECAERLAAKHFQETYIPSEMELESPDVKLERMKKAYKKKYEDFRSHAALGWDVLFKELTENHDPEREKIVKALNLPLEKILQFTDVEAISGELDHDQGRAWYEVLGLSKEQINKLYETARGIFEKKQYKDASDAFFTLISLSPREYRMWFGYGMAKKLERDNLEVALDAFSVANTLKPGRPEPFIHAAECYIEQGNRSEAERCLAHGKELFGNENEYLKEWAEQLEKKL